MSEQDFDDLFGSSSPQPDMSFTDMIETPDFMRAFDDDVADTSLPMLSSEPTAPAWEAPEPANDNSDRPLTPPLMVSSPSEIPTPGPRHRPQPEPRDPFMDIEIPAQEQDFLLPSMLPPMEQGDQIQAFPMYNPAAPPPFANWYGQAYGQSAPYGQPYAQPYPPPFPPYMQPPPVARQHDQGQYGQPLSGMAPPQGMPGQFFNQPAPNNAGQGETGETANLPAINLNNKSIDDEDVTMLDVPAEEGENIEYVSASGDVLTSSDVRFNPAIGHYLPLTQRKKEAIQKRSGPRPGSGNKKEPLYDMCKWKGPYTEDSDGLGINVYGDIFDAPEDWCLPNNLGKICYNKEGCLPDGTTLSARQIRSYIDNNPRNLRISVSTVPSQANHRLYASECIWACCPNPKRNIRQGFHQVVFDEYPEQTDIGDRDPFRIAGRMHLWCYEQCFDIVEDFKCGRVKPELRSLIREAKNPMSLSRDRNIAVQAETYEPWFRYHILNSNGPLQGPRPFDKTLAHALSMHHLRCQNNVRQAKREQRNKKKKNPDDAKSLDVHQGDLELYQQLDNGNVSQAYQWEREQRSQEAFRSVPGVSDYTLPGWFGSKALGTGFLLDESLIDKTSRGKKRGRDSNEDGDEDAEGEDEELAEVVEEPPAKRTRTSRASSTASASASAPSKRKRTSNVSSTDAAPAKRMRTSRASSAASAPSPRHSHATRRNTRPGDIILPKMD